MDILNSLGDALHSGQTGDQSQGLLESVSGLLGGSGGLQSLIESFTGNGLGDTISSWIGNGDNLPISADQISQILGNEQIASIAQKLGLSTQDASNGLASLLPQVIDKLTPDGNVPNDSSIQNGLGGLLKGFRL